MKYITLSLGKSGKVASKKAIIDDEDYETVVQHQWSYRKKFKDQAYEKAYCEKIRTTLANFIIKPKVNYYVFFKNGNHLDCRKENLVIMNKSQFNAATKPFS